MGQSMVQHEESKADHSLGKFAATGRKKLGQERHGHCNGHAMGHLKA